MGTSHSWAELGGKLDRLAQGVGQMSRPATEEAALFAKKTLSAALPSRLRGVGKKGAKIGVRYNLGYYPDGAKALVFPTGPVQLVEADTKAHRIPKERGTRARRRYAVIPGVGVRAYANHPGTHGKHIWQRTVTALLPVLDRPYRVALANELRKIF